MIIGITGPIASGKTAIVDLLVQKEFSYFKLSEEVRDEAKSLGIPIERKALQDLGNAMREKFGNSYWAERIVKKIEPGKNCVIDGIRNAGEVDAFRKLKDFILIGVSAPVEKRLQWILTRNKDSDPKTLEEIKAIDARDRGVGEDAHGQQTEKCFSMAEVFISNEGTFEELMRKASETIEGLKC